MKRFLSIMIALILVLSPLQMISAMADSDIAETESAAELPENIGVPAEDISAPEDIAAEESSNAEDETAAEAEYAPEVVPEVNAEAAAESEAVEAPEADAEAESEAAESAEADTEAESKAEEVPVETDTDAAAEEADSEDALLSEEATVYTSGNWEYEVTGGGARLRKYSGSQSSVVIPDTIGGYTVTTIGNNCMFGNTYVQTLTIPENIVTIEYNAFKNCYSLSRLYFNAKSCTVNSDAFLNIGASSSSLDVVFGYGVTKIPDDIFNGSEDNFARITSVTISDTVRIVGTHAFEHCHYLKTIKWGSKVDTINNYAFACCYALESLNLPASLSTIDYNAFENCRDMTTLTIPASVTKIGSWSFNGCLSLTRINYNAKNASASGYPFMNCGSSADKLEFVAGSGVTVIPTVLLASHNTTGYCRVTSVKLSDTVKTIRSEAFMRCYDLKTITWGSGLEVIEADAFRYCSSLTGITFPGRLTKIGNEAFSECTSLKNVTIPASVTTIEYNAFYKCTDLAKVTVYSKNATYGGSAFKECSTSLIIYCYKDSTLPTYAEREGIKYKYLADSSMFSDVTNPNAAYYTPVYWGVKKGIVTGYSDGTFRPNNPCTRGQVVMFLWRAAGKPAPKSGSVKFKDVPTSHSYYKAILWASQKGIATGYSDGTFRPNDTCTRGQIVMFLWRYAGKPNPKSGVKAFPDVPKSHSYYTAIMWAAGKGITTGFSDGTFRPNQKCTRGQCITFIYRYMN